MNGYIVGIKLKADSPEEAKEIFLKMMADNLFNSDEVVTMERGSTK